jgi:hypothetical protein
MPLEMPPGRRMSHRATARIVGALFILATVPFSISVIVLEPVLGSPDFLALASEAPGRIRLGSALELVNHIAVVSIAVVISPVLRLSGERLALGYVAARSIESVLFIIATMHLLALLHVSGAFVEAGAPPNSHFQTLGDLLYAGHDWNRAPLAFSAFAIGALLLNYRLFTARLVPRWISGFGLIAAASILTARVMMLVGVQVPPATVTQMDGPIFLQEMIFAVWLIARGFNISETALEAECDLE